MTRALEYESLDELIKIRVRSTLWAVPTYTKIYKLYVRVKVHVGIHVCSMSMYTFPRRRQLLKDKIKGEPTKKKSPIDLESG